MAKTFLERARELKKLASDAQRKRDDPKMKRGVDMDERWAPTAVYEHEELFTRNSEEILAVVEAVDAVARHNDNCICVLCEAIKSLDRKAGE